MSKNRLEIGDNLMTLLIVAVLVAGMVLGSVVKCKGQGQSDTMYCMPINQARRAAEYAIKKLEQDTLIHEMRLDLVRKHLDLQDTERRFAEFREMAERIQAGDRTMTDALEKNVRHWQAEARRRERIWEAGRWLIPAAFGLGVLVGK